MNSLLKRILKFPKFIAFKSSKRDQAHCFGFPFIVWVSKVDPPDVEVVRVHHRILRIYPPYFGKEIVGNTTNFHSKDIPFLSGTRKHKGPHFTSGPTVRPNNTETTYFTNCLRIDVLDAHKDENLDFIQQFLQRILGHVRNECNQWEIGSRDFYGTYFVGGFKTNKKGDQLEQMVRRISYHTHPRGAALTSLIWKDAIDRAVRFRDPRIEKTYLLDAYGQIIKEEFSKCVLSMCWAIELFRDRSFRFIWSNLKPGIPYRKGKALTGNNLITHLDGDLLALTGVSYKDQSPDDFALIKKLWKTRNNVAHGQPATYRDGKKVVPLDISIAMSFHEATGRCLLWLSALNKSQKKKGDNI